MTVDIKSAYFNATVTRDIFIEISKEDTTDDDVGKIGKLSLCPYDTRDAAFNWAQTVARQLVGDKLTRYRSLAARTSYLALGRPDLQFAVKELCRAMSKPMESFWKKLVRVGKYSIHRPRMILEHHWQEPVNAFSTLSDANLAGCTASRKSISKGTISAGRHLIKSWSKIQTNIQLSSAESEFYSTLKAAQKSLGMVALARKFDQEMKVDLKVDASAALGVAQRAEIGNVRHLDTG